MAHPTGFEPLTSAFGGREWHLGKLYKIKVQITLVAYPRNHQDPTSAVSNRGGVFCWLKKGQDLSQGPDQKHVRGARPSRSLYCGPCGFMQAAEAAVAHWPAETRHFEYFTAPDTPAMAAGDKSIVEVLRGNGIDVETSCESGLCGTCWTRYLVGEPEHHDLTLDDGDGKSDVLICCARALSPVLVLDL